MLHCCGRATAEWCQYASMKPRIAPAEKSGFDILVEEREKRLVALDAAIAEVNQLSGFHVTYEPIKRGRSVTAVRLSAPIASVAKAKATPPMTKLVSRQGMASAVQPK